MSHSESVQSNQQSLEEIRLKKTQELLKELQRDSAVALHTQGPDHSEHVHENRELLDRQFKEASFEYLEALQKKSNQVLDRKEEHIAEISRRASSKDSLEQAHARKELYDSIDQSEKRLKEHERELKHEFVEANKADLLMGVVERQKKFQ
ncbi:hypothetical protein EDD86DRAFT_248221 [Gorgonomyces haynaldii]|nr:hypothetical protein EDD86DRAFT_248221 [Gorgonomyces haynaldii]